MRPPYVCVLTVKVVKLDLKRNKKREIISGRSKQALHHYSKVQIALAPGVIRQGCTFCSAEILHNWSLLWSHLRIGAGKKTKKKRGRDFFLYCFPVEMSVILHIFLCCQQKNKNLHIIGKIGIRSALHNIQQLKSFCEHDLYLYLETHPSSVFDQTPVLRCFSWDVPIHSSVVGKRWCSKIQMHANKENMLLLPDSSYHVDIIRVL